jgi:hypothetical protein
MPVSRREARGGRAFALPLLGIAVLLAFYWLLADWQRLPSIIDAAIGALH